MSYGQRCGTTPSPTVILLATTPSPGRPHWYCGQLQARSLCASNTGSKSWVVNRIQALPVLKVGSQQLIMAPRKRLDHHRDAPGTDNGSICRRRQNVQTA